MAHIPVVTLFDDNDGSVREVHAFCSLECLDAFMLSRHPWQLPMSAGLAAADMVVNEARCSGCFTPIFR